MKSMKVGKINLNPLVIVFFFALLLRVALAFSDYYHSDIGYYHISWANYILTHGPQGFYEYFYGKGAVYPPLIIFIFAILLSAYRLFSSVLPYIGNREMVLVAFMKIPAILSDLGIAYLVVKFTSKIDKKIKLEQKILFAALVLFNPAFFYNSSYWGQIDSIPLFFVVWSIYLLLEKKYVASPIVFITALLMKQTAVLFLPLYFIFYLWKVHRIDVFFKSLGACLLVFYVSYIPFIPKGGSLLYPIVEHIKIASTFGSTYLSITAYNFWWIVSGQRWILDSKTIFGVYFGTYATLFFLMIYLTVIILFLRGKKTIKNIFWSLFLIGVTGFLVLTKMHERHLIIALPFLLLMCLYSKKYISLYGFFSLFHLLNLYDAWHKPNIVFLNIALNNQIVIFSLIFAAYLFTISEFFLFVRSRK